MQLIHSNKNCHHHHHHDHTHLYPTSSTSLASSEMHVISNISAKELYFKISSYNIEQSERSGTQLELIIYISKYK
jgi:hypothetical protein